MRAVLITLLMIIAGCGTGPSDDILRKDVMGRLSLALPPGHVVLTTFDRRGSQADTKAPSGEVRRIIYYDVVLSLERDFNFSAWDSSGVAGLVSALGSGPKGITGINSGGNKVGDKIRAHGTLIYKLEGNQWSSVISGGYRPSAAPSIATNERQSGPIAILESMRKVIDSLPKDSAPVHRAVIEEELAAAHAAIRARLARATNGYAIAAGPEHGQYLRFAQALSSGATPHMIPLVTHGGEENLRLLRAGKVSLALGQGDAALEAYEGKGSFASDGPHTILRALGSLYPEPVHVLVRTDSAVTSVIGLKGKRVAIGQLSSASRTTALRVLEAHGLSVKDITPLELSIRDALVGLRQKDVDAVIQLIGVPADSVRDALADIPLRLLPLPERIVTALVAMKAGYFAYTIPQGTYANQKQEIRTVATAALLLVGADLSETEIGTFTRFVFQKDRDWAARGSAQGVQVTARTAREGLSIPLHAGAAKALDAMEKRAIPVAPMSDGK